MCYILRSVNEIIKSVKSGCKGAHLVVHASAVLSHGIFSRDNTVT